MSAESDVHKDPIAVVESARKRRGVGYIGIALVLAVLTGSVGIAVNEADTANDEVTAVRDEATERDVRIKNLEKALNAQRAQFEACKNKSANSPGCTTPVAPAATDIGPQGVQGLQGIPGPRGPQGPQGPQGLQGLQGVQGVPGLDGDDGTNGSKGRPGIAGSDGTDGVNGQPGATGSKGDTGVQGPEGPRGPEGQIGPQGPPGTDAEPPETFTFTDALGGTQICTRDGGTAQTPQYTCS